MCFDFLVVLIDTHRLKDVEDKSVTATATTSTASKVIIHPLLDIIYQVFYAVFSSRRV